MIATKWFSRRASALWVNISLRTCERGECEVQEMQTIDQNLHIWFTFSNYSAGLHRFWNRTRIAAPVCTHSTNQRFLNEFVYEFVFWINNIWSFNPNPTLRFFLVADSLWEVLNCPCPHHSVMIKKAPLLGWYRVTLTSPWDSLDTSLYTRTPHFMHTIPTKWAPGCAVRNAVWRVPYLCQHGDNGWERVQNGANMVYRGEIW